MVSLLHSPVAADPIVIIDTPPWVKARGGNGGRGRTIHVILCLYTYGAVLSLSMTGHHLLVWPRRWLGQAGQTISANGMGVFSPTPPRKKLSQRGGLRGRAMRPRPQLNTGGSLEMRRPFVAPPLRVSTATSALLVPVSGDGARDNEIPASTSKSLER